MEKKKSISIVDIFPGMNKKEIINLVLKDLFPFTKEHNANFKIYLTQNGPQYVHILINFNDVPKAA